ncbi:MAG: serine hydrolase domain-containing protein [Aeromicrobium sp.]
MPKHPDTERRILRAFGLPALGWLALVGLLAAPASAAQSAPVDPDAVDAFVESQMSRHGIPGVALALIEDGRVTYTQGYGDAGEGRPMTADTPMPIASISKSFTAVAVLQMVEQDRIDLDAPVRAYLPWFEVADAGVSQAITIRHLLNQTSGLNELGYNRVLAPDTSLEDGVRDLRHAEAAAAPGERFHYFNPNYATLALVIEKVSGRSYAVVVDKSILGPLSMTRSTADWDAVVGEVAQGHIKQFGFAIPQDPPYRPARTGADNVISTAADLASFLVAVGLPDGSGASLLEEGSFETMHAQPDVDEPGYAMGWELSEYRGEPVGGHSGNDPTYSSQMAGLTEQGGGYVVLMNQDHLIQSNLLTGREARSGWLGMRFYGAVLLLVFALWLFFTIRSVFRLRGWRERSRRRSAGSLAWDIGSHFLMAALLVLLMYQLVPALIGRGFNLTDVGRYYFLPDLTLLVFGSVVADLAQGSYRLVTVLVTRFFVRERFAGP